MTITKPETPDQVVDLLNDSKRFGEIVGAGEFGSTINHYVGSMVDAKGGDLMKQLDAQAQVAIANYLKGEPAGGTGRVSPPELAGGVLPPGALEDAERGSYLNSGINMRAAARRNRLFGKRAIGAALDSEPYAASIGDFLQAVWHRAEDDADKRDTIRAWRSTMKNALSERVPSQGGFLIPEVLRSQILMFALESAVVRPRARIVPMDSLRIPYPTIDDTSHTSSVYGGVIGFWAEEAAALSQSQPAFGRIELEAHKLTGYTQIPNELLHDAVQALDQWFSDFFPIALAFFEDVAFITGSGVGQPQGYQNAPAAVTVTRATATKIRFADFANMYAQMMPMSLNRATWVISPDCIPQLLQLAVTDPGGTTVAPPIFLNGMSAQGTPDFTILGRPVVVTEKHPALGSTGDVAFVDFGYYLLGDRQSMIVSSSEHYLFANDLTAFRVIERVDGRVWMQSPLTLENSSANKLSPVVLLHA